MLLPVTREGLPRDLIDLERPQHPLPIFGAYPLCRFWIHLPEVLEDGFRVSIPFRGEPFAVDRVSRRRGEQTFQEGADIEMGAADYDGGVTAVHDVGSATSTRW